MNDKRKNWNQKAAEEMQRKSERKMELIQGIKDLGPAINEAASGRRWDKYDELMAQRAELTAELSTL